MAIFWGRNWKQGEVWECAREDARVGHGGSGTHFWGNQNLIQISRKIFPKITVPGNSASAGDLFGMVNMRSLKKGLLVTSNVQG